MFPALPSNLPLHLLSQQDSVPRTHDGDHSIPTRSHDEPMQEFSMPNTSSDFEEYSSPESHTTDHLIHTLSMVPLMGHYGEKLDHVPENEMSPCYSNYSEHDLSSSTNGSEFSRHSTYAATPGRDSLNASPLPPTSSSPPSSFDSNCLCIGNQFGYVFYLEVILNNGDCARQLHLYSSWN